MHLPGGVFRRDVERREVAEIVLDLRPLDDGETHVGKDRRQFVRHLADGMDVALRFRPGRQGHVDALGRQTGFQFRLIERRLAVLDGGGDLVLQRVEGRTGRLALLRAHAAQALHELGDSALLAQGVDAHSFQRRLIVGFADGGDEFFLQVCNIIHNVQSPKKGPYRWPLRGPRGLGSRRCGLGC